MAEYQACWYAAKRLWQAGRIAEPRWYFQDYHHRGIGVGPTGTVPPERESARPVSIDNVVPEERINTYMPPVATAPPRPRDPIPHKQAKEARRGAAICGMCGAALSSADPIRWRQFETRRPGIDDGRFWYDTVTAPVCAACFGDGGDQLIRGQCVNCRRPMQMRVRDQHSMPTYCCDRCGWRYQRRQRAAWDRQRRQRRTVTRVVK
jgi:hypothetical protein